MSSPAQCLPSLSNLFAIFSEDGHALDRHLAQMQRSGLFKDVARPAPGWAVGVAPLPGSEWAHPRSPRTLWIEGIERFPSDAPSSWMDDAFSTPSRIASLTGDFGFVHFLGDGRVLGARSCGGRVPLYAWSGPGFTLVSTTLTYIGRLAPATPRIDPMPTGIWTTGWTLFPDGRTFFRDVKIVDRGGFVAIDQLRRTHGSYWNPRHEHMPWPTKKTKREHAERLRSILLNHLESELDPGGRNLLSLSGGVDSSSLAALAVRRVGRNIATISFVPDREPFLSEEMLYIDSIRKVLGVERYFDYSLTYSDRLRLIRGAPVVAFPVLHPVLGAIPEVLQHQEIAVVFGGEFADEVCGSRFTFPDWIRDVGPLGLIRTIGGWPEGAMTLRRWIGRRVRARRFLPYPRTLPALVRQEVRDEYREWRSRKALELSSAPPLAYLALHAAVDGFVAMNWEVLSLLDIRRAWPFFNREALELAFDVHPAERVGPGIKLLLKGAVKDDVPGRNLYRESSGTWPATDDDVPPPTLGPIFADTFDPARLEEPGMAPVTLIFAWALAGMEGALSKREE